MTRTVALAALVVLAAVGPLAAASGASDLQAHGTTDARVTGTDSATVATTTATDAESEVYAGTNVSFRAEGSAIANYAVDNDTVATAVRVQSASEVEAGLGIGFSGDLAAVTDVAGAALAVEARSDANLTAAVHGESRLVVRAYEDRDEEERTEERMIVEGTVTAAVYVDAEADDTVAGTVTYDGNTSVEFDGRSDGEIEMRVERSRHEGAVVVVESDAAVEADANVTVSEADRNRTGDSGADDAGSGDTARSDDGGAQSGDATGSDDGSRSADATTGPREASSGDSPAGGETTGGSGPGFSVWGVLSVVLGLVGAALARPTRA